MSAEAIADILEENIEPIELISNLICKFPDSSDEDILKKFRDYEEKSVNKISMIMMGEKIKK